MNTDLAMHETAPAATPRGQHHRKTTFSLLQSARQLMALVLLSVLACLFVNRFVLQAVVVKGQSMFPTLHNQDHYYLNRWIYHFHHPRCGDVVVFKDPTDGTYVVKRVIASPGDAVFLDDGYVYVNGRRLREPYLPAGTRTWTLSKASAELILCGRNQYFMLGDNRNDSFDSRIYGPVPGRNILGAIIR